MSDMEDRTPREDVLVGGLDDWADAGWVYSSTRLAGVVDAESRRMLTIGLIVELIVEGLMIPVTWTSKGTTLGRSLVEKP